MKFSNFVFILTWLFSAPSFAFQFIAIGDTGKANSGQYAVGSAAAEDCQRNQCRFGILLGDNFYDEGVTSANDPQFVEKFEKPYSNFPQRFFITLGNHDYGKKANQWERGQFQIDYGQRNPRWVLPHFYYTFKEDKTRFIVLDTSRLFHGKDVEEQRTFVTTALKLAKDEGSQWTVLIMHHPYLSNGKHGNAGSYDGVPIPPYSGNHVKKLIEDLVCNKVDLVLSGHDHSLQVLKSPRNCDKTLFVVSGAGASASNDLTQKNPTWFQTSTLGYTSVDVSAQEITVTHRNEKTQDLYQHTLRK